MEYDDTNSTCGKHIQFPGGVAARDVFTGEIFVSDTPGGLSKLTNVPSKLIKKKLLSDNPYPLYGFDFKPVKSCKWIVYTDEELKAFKGLKFIHQPVLVETRCGKRILFGSVKDASSQTGVGERTIRGYLNGTQVNSGEYIFSRYDKIT